MNSSSQQLIVDLDNFELPGFEKDIQEMIIEVGFGNDYYGYLIIENYPNLQSIIMKRNSLRNLNSLKICNCEKLKAIEIEDGWREGAFSNVKNVIIESIWLFDFDISIFLNYNHSKQEIGHSLKQQVYLYQVILSNSTLVYIFLIYNHSKQEKIHSYKQQVYLYQVILSNSTYFLYLPQLNQISLGPNSFAATTSITLQSTFAFSLFPFLDVPFSNGNYSVAPNRWYGDNETFHHITSSSITYDPSIFLPPSSQIASQSLSNLILTIRPH